jgi:hypothetical protein
MILAQADPITALAGQSGWYGLGLLGLVMSWLLLVHLPAKDKQLKEYLEIKDSQFKTAVDSKDKIILELVESRNQTMLTAQNRIEQLARDTTDKQDRIISNLTAEFKNSLNAVIDHCKEEISTMIEREK